MMPRDLHRVDASLLVDDRAIQVAGEVEQRCRIERPTPADAHQDRDDEQACDTAFNVRVYALLAVYLVAVLIVLGVILPPVIRLAMRYGG